VKLTTDEADRLAREQPPYPPPSDSAEERCAGKTGWHRPQVDDWNDGNRGSTCTWCGKEIERTHLLAALRTTKEGEG